MEDSLAVGVLDALRDRRHDPRRPLHAHRPALHERRQIAALHEIHREVGAPLVLPGLVDSDNVGMLESRDGGRLDAKPLGLVGTRPFPAENHLDGNLAAESVLSRPVHHPHAATRDLAQDLIITHLPGRRAGCHG